MGIINFLRTGKWSSKPSVIRKDFKAAVSKPRNSIAVQESITQRPRQAVSTIQYKHQLTGRGWPYQSSGDFAGPIYNLGEIAKVLDVEGYFAASVRRHRELALKEGWHLRGKNPETVEYIKNRLNEISMISGEPIGAMIREGLTNLIAYATSFFILKRDSTRSSGSPIRLFGKKLDPISGIYSADPSTMSVKKNEFGRPVAWRQKVSGEEGKTRIFHYQDVIVSCLDRKSGFTFGTPYVIPVLDDIRALRRLEELVELVTHKNTFPFFHARVGTEKLPAGYVTSPDGTQTAEVEVVRSQIDAMPPEGGLVTSERVEITMLGQQGEVLDLKPYLEHFENRVLGGLRLSGIDLGRGDTANRATAQTVTKNLVDACTEIQNTFAEIWTSKINDILLLEGGFDLNDDNRVFLVFPEIDREEMRAHQNHGQQLFMNNLITEDEFRREFMGLEPITDEDRMKTMFEMYTKKLAIISAVDEPFTEEAKASSRAVANKTQPANQFGIAATKKSVPANDGMDERRPDLDVAEKYYQQLNYYWMELMKEFQSNSGHTIKNGKIVNKSEHFKGLLHGYTTLMIGDAKKLLSPIIDKGYRFACNDISCKFNMSKDIYYYFFNKFVKSQLIKTNRKCMIMLNVDADRFDGTGSMPDKFEIAGVFQSLLSELRLASLQQTDLAFKVGYLEAFKRNEQPEIKVVPDSYNASEIWAGQESRIVKLDEIAKRDFMNPSSDCRFFLVPNQEERQEGVSDE